MNQEHLRIIPCSCGMRIIRIMREESDIFVEFWNAYNRQNVETYYWDDRIRKVSYFNFIPVGGFEFEF